MYVHPAFKIDEVEARQLLQKRGFGTVIVGTAGAPQAVHVPFLLLDEAGKTRIEFHVARNNPLHAAIGGDCKVLLVCRGPDAYVSPDWYGVANQVPAWTYWAVHVTGIARIVPAEDNLAHVDRLSLAFEERLLPKPIWSSEKMDGTRRAALLNAIVKISIDAETIEGQKKLIQHKGEMEHEGAIAGLRGRGDADSLAMAAMMAESARSKIGS